MHITISCYCLSYSMTTFQESTQSVLLHYMKGANITQTPDTKDVLLSFNIAPFRALTGGSVLLHYMKGTNITQTPDTKDVLLSFNIAPFRALTGG